MGNENFPSERSSAKPLFVVYLYQMMIANLVVLKIHIVISDLKVDPDQVDQRDVITGMDLGRHR
jgi:hypothetical protein